MGKMRDELEKERAPRWDPEPGDILEGTIVDIGSYTGDYGTSPVITVLEEDGERQAFFASSTICKQEIMDKQPRLGDIIGVIYKGMRTPKNNGPDYHDYRILVEHTGPQAQASEAPRSNASQQTRQPPVAGDEEPF